MCVCCLLRSFQIQRVCSKKRQQESVWVLQARATLLKVSRLVCALLNRKISIQIDHIHKSFRAGMVDILTCRGALLWPAKDFVGVRVVVLVVRNQLEALRSERAAEVPLPDGRVPVSMSVSAHLCPGLQGGDVPYTELHQGQQRLTHAHVCVLLH